MEEQPETETVFISRAEAAALLGVKRQTLWNWANSGYGPPYYPMGKSKTQYDRDEVIRWRDSQRVDPENEQ